MATENHAERTDAPTDVETQKYAETRLHAFKAAYMALPDADRATAAAWIAEQNRATA